MNLYSLRYANGKELCVKYKKSVYQSLVLITQFGINMMVPIFLCTGLGIFIDKKSRLFYNSIIYFRSSCRVSKLLYRSKKNIRK